jgi:rhodanese-related sulfurtransferase
VRVTPKQAWAELDAGEAVAAASLHDLGLRKATDVIGGVEAWRAAGLPLQRLPDPS